MENMDRIVHKIVLRIALMGYVTMSTDHVTVRKKIMGTLNVINVSLTLRSKLHFAIHVNKKILSMKINNYHCFCFIVLIYFRVFCFFAFWGFLGGGGLYIWFLGGFCGG